MTDETLTDEEREQLQEIADVSTKALRILDALTERIERALKILGEPWPMNSPEARLAGDLRRVLGD